MHYLSLENISKTYADKPLFTNVNAHINEGDKIALVALNGSGKSTLLKIINGSEKPDTGQVWVNKNVQIVTLEQQQYFDETKNVNDIIFDLSHPILKALHHYHNILEIEPENTTKIQDISNELDALNAWHFDSTVELILSQLKITEFNKPIKVLSGGEKKRLALAKILIDLEFNQSHALIILDEPTNHLDVEMIEWLEHYLSKSKVTLLVVTHDRYFLDNVCNKIFEISQRNFYIIQGNYEKYLETKAIREEQFEASVDKAKNRYRKELEWMRKQPRARTTKSKSRQDAFYEWKEKAHKKLEHSSLELDMKMTRLGGKVVEMKKVYKKYGDKTILNGFDYNFKNGERIGIVGKNGVGKSTFIHMMMGIEQPDSGKINIGDTVVFGNFSQKGLEVKNGIRVIEYVKNIAEYFPLADGTKLSAEQFLQKFNFTPEKQFSFVEKLSGGELKRLQLLTVLYNNPNVLILDEPTNDLDLPTLDVLEDFLLNYPGCIIIISHDRYFMDKIVDHIFVFKGEGEVQDFPGTYSIYRQVEKENNEEQKKSTTEFTEPTQQIAKPKTTTQKLSYKEKRELEEIEQKMPLLQKEKEDLELEVSQGIDDYELLLKKSQRISDIINELDEIELRWLELSEKQ